MHPQGIAKLFEPFRVTRNRIKVDEFHLKKKSIRWIKKPPQVHLDGRLHKAWKKDPDFRNFMVPLSQMIKAGNS